MDLSMIPEFFKNYGWQLGLLALSGIVLLGFLKWIGVFKKINADYKKYLYFGLSCAFSIIACTIYILMNNAFDWINYGIMCGSVICLTSGAYTIYEHTGLRALVRICILNPIAKLFKILTSASLSKADKERMAKELGSEVLNNLVIEARKNEVAKAAQEAEKVAKQEASQTVAKKQE